MDQAISPPPRHEFAPGIDFDVGALQPSERSFTLSSWKRSLRKHVRIPTTAYYAWIGAETDALLSRFPLMLAARRDGVVIGWLCAEATDGGVVVHYSYTKSAYRRQGIARALLGEALSTLAPLAGPGLFYVHRTFAEPTARRYGFELLGRR